MTEWERADAAKRLLADPVLREAFAALRERMVAQMEACPISDVDTQHEVALMLQLLKRVRHELERYVQDGVVVEHNAKHETWLEKLRSRIG